MKCDYCGTEISERQRFCPFCGTRQAPAPKAEPVPLPAAGPLPGMDFADDSVPVPVHPPALDEETFTWRPYQAGPSPETPVYSEEPEAPAYPEPSPAPTAPRIQLPTGRGLAKMVFLGLITLGIYPLVIWSRIVTELNLAASRHDGVRTMPYFAMLILTPITLGIFTLVWFHRFSRRVGLELQRRGIDCRFGPRDYWLWNILGTLILAGPFVYVHKLMKAMNAINADFNARG